jgi:O-antigen/teichoic acid export membrane protein
VTNVVLNLLLIPPLGALGAALGTATTLVVHNILKQVGLGFDTGVGIFDSSTSRVYLVIAAAATVLIGVTLFVDLSLPALLGTAALTSVVVLVVNRHALRIADTFPAVARLPGGRWFTGGQT